MVLFWGPFTRMWYSFQWKWPPPPPPGLGFPFWGRMQGIDGGGGCHGGSYTPCDYVLVFVFCFCCFAHVLAIREVARCLGVWKIDNPPPPPFPPLSDFSGLGAISKTPPLKKKILLTPLWIEMGRGDAVDVFLSKECLHQCVTIISVHNMCTSVRYYS